MDLFGDSAYGSNIPQFAHVSLRKYDPFYYRYKAYRDGIISANILRKATQLVAQIEGAKLKPPSYSLNATVESIMNRRGSLLDTQS